jgi:hypothetical protein
LSGVFRFCPEICIWLSFVPQDKDVYVSNYPILQLFSLEPWHVFRKPPLTTIVTIRCCSNSSPIMNPITVANTNAEPQPLETQPPLKIAALAERAREPDKADGIALRQAFSPVNAGRTDDESSACQPESKINPKQTKALKRKWRTGCARKRRWKSSS